MDIDNMDEVEMILLGPFDFWAFGRLLTRGLTGLVSA